MPTTSNFGWTTPADTDYVKDGALAIRTLGNGIDTSLVDLKGGTTGQILSKASNTDLDYTWINNDQGDITAVNVSSPITGGGTSGAVTISIQDGTTAQKGAVQLENSTSSTSTTTAAVPASVKSAYDLANAAIPKSIVDAAGDIIYATANDTVARLALGTAGQVLKVNSGATAPEWAAAGAGSLTLVKSTTFTGVASVTEDNVFTSTYANYLMLIYVTSATSNGFVTLQFRAGGSTTTSNYNYYYYGYNGTAADDGAGTAQSSMAVGYSLSGAACSTVTIFSPQEAKNTYVNSIAFRSGAAANSFGANQTDNTQFDGFVLDSAGNFTGTVRVYGYSNS